MSMYIWVCLTAYIYIYYAIISILYQLSKNIYIFIQSQVYSFVHMRTKTN